jgi:hypothetical protein
MGDKCSTCTGKMAMISIFIKIKDKEISFNLYVSIQNYIQDGSKNSNTLELDKKTPCHKTLCILTPFTPNCTCKILSISMNQTTTHVSFQVH